MNSAPQRSPWVELLAALLIALGAAAFVLRDGLFAKDSILFGVDTATVQLPWSKAIGRADGRAPLEPRNAGLADQGVFFYPAYRFAIDSWRRGDTPLWNPLICAGSPAVGNPQLGVLDPEVAILGALESIGGGAWRDRGFAWLAWLRLAAAGLGAYLFARRLGLSIAGATISSATFASSGFVVAWLGFSLGHVAVVLPWILLALESSRGARGNLAIAATALVTALAIYGGHPETAFYVGLASAVWAFAIFASDRRAGIRALVGLALGVLLASPSLAPFLEYLQSSGARVAREAIPHGEPDWIALALLVFAWWIAARFRRSRSIASESEHAASCGTFAWEAPIRWASVAAFVLFAWAILLVFAERGLAPSARMLLLPDVFGAPEHGGWRGSGQYIESASAWIPFASLALALAALLSPKIEGATRLPRRAAVIALALAGLALAISLSGIVDLVHLVPFIGMGAGVRAAVVGALFLGLLAGEGFDSASRAARIASALFFVGALALAAWSPRIPIAHGVVDQDDELVHFSVRPQSRADGGKLALEGLIDASVPVAAVRARVERLAADGTPIASSVIRAPLDLADRPWTSDPSAVASAPPNAHFFRAGVLEAKYLEPGTWRFALELVDLRGEVLSTRVASISAIERKANPSALSLVFALGGLLLVAFRPRGRGGVAFALVLIAAQAADFARGQNPAVPSSECFPPTRTVEILKREIGGGRYFADAGVMPANTGMIDGLASLDGYDSVDVASFDALRSLVVKPGVHPLLGFNASGADLDAPLFKMFGVTLLALAAPIDRPEWEIVAGPANGDPEFAEAFVYRARHPLPRAFVVGRRVSLDVARANPYGFDPAREVLLDDAVEWKPAKPLASASVVELARQNDLVRLKATLDGDGMLVLAEQYFPGWKLEVDGEPRAILCVDAIFRGAALSSGEHTLVFRYEPASWRIGLVLASIGALGVLASLVAAFRSVFDSPRDPAV